MQFDIERVPARDLSIADFFSDYYESENPVVLTELDPPFAGEIIPRVWCLAHEDQAQAGNAHIAIPLQDDSAKLRTPALVKAVFARRDIVHKPKPLKLWAQPQGHRSLLHYDGNSLHGLNWQVAGRKHWLLMSPDTPARMMPFSSVAMAGEGFEPNPRQHRFCEFETMPGDMLFLPRYWSHRVTCLEARNANLDWVWTPERPNLGVATGRRECATLKLRRMLGRFDRHLRYRVSLDDYADGGLRLFDNYANAVGKRELIPTAFREFGSLFLLPLFARDVERQMQKMRDNNFPVGFGPA